MPFKQSIKQGEKMRSCKNCINGKGYKIDTPCRKCHNRSNWEHDGLPSVCDGCAYFGKYKAESRHCYHCIDGSKWISPELYEKKKLRKVLIC